MMADPLSQDAPPRPHTEPQSQPRPASEQPAVPTKPIASGGGDPEQPQNPPDEDSNLAQSTQTLESKLRTLRTKSAEVSQSLTARLASSQSGQNLLHIGPSLSTLPPDLHTLLTGLRPILAEVEKYELSSKDELRRIVDAGTNIRLSQRRVDEARECAGMYQDLVASERDVGRDARRREQQEDEEKVGRRSKGGSGSAPSSGNAAAVSSSASPSSLGQRRWRDDDAEAATATARIGTLDEWDGDGTDGDGMDELDHVASLERAAHTTLHLVQELKSSTAEVSALTSSSHMPHQGGSAGGAGGGAAPTNGNSSVSATLPTLRAPLPDDTEKAQFLMKLAPRIRRLESDAVRCLTARLEGVLDDVKRRKAEGGGQRQQGGADDASDAGGGDTPDGSLHGVLEPTDRLEAAKREEMELLMIGHCLRGLALLGRGKEAESAFARVAIMPLIRSKVSMGRLDEGGARGECAGLFTLLDDIACTIYSTFGPVLCLSEAMFDAPTSGAIDNGIGDVEVDLVTAGVWAPIATALMADPAIKMALFSPGIAGILQANYTALDTFLSELAGSLLKRPQAASGTGASSPSGGEFAALYFRATISPESTKAAQARIYRHPITADFTKKWNLPIYYQLRFGECCTRLNKAMARVQREGWQADVFTGDEAFASELCDKQGFELPLFLELYDTLAWLWRPDVILRPLSHRFLRGSTQLIGRIVAFVRDGLDGRLRFGETGGASGGVKAPGAENGRAGINGEYNPEPAADTTFCWSERLEDVAAVAWELTVLETCITHDYVEAIVDAIAPQDVADSASIQNTEPELDELRSVVSDALSETSQDIGPLIRKSWSDVIVGILTGKCSAPLSAVKGVAATYRMTNRPPPTQASPFVATILRPLKEFDDTFATRTPPQVGSGWKRTVIGTVSGSYSAAVQELITTVERTENTLKTRKLRRMTSGGMSDGDKVKLQLFLDHQEFARNVEEVGVDVNAVAGLVKLKSLTEGAATLYAQTQRRAPRTG